MTIRGIYKVENNRLVLAFRDGEERPSSFSTNVTGGAGRAFSVRTYERVAPGTVGTLTIEIGGTSEVVDVKGESPMIQAASGERSFTIQTEAVTNLPISNRSFTALASLSPGGRHMAPSGNPQSQAPG